MNDKKVLNKLQKYTMIFILVLVVGFFSWQTGGKLLWPQNITNIISQNAYVFVLTAGMLLCILTGGNIDLSVGSVVCFVGAIGALILSKGVNLWVAVIAMLAIGLVIGAWQAFWIAYIRVPPFIVTLAGMFVFRGLSNVVLDGKTVSVTNQSYIRLFGGGADCYISDPFGGASLNVLCMIIGIIACLIYIGFVVKGISTSKKHNNQSETLVMTIVKTAIIVAAIMFFTVKLSQYKGIPTSLAWVALIIVIYAFITSKTTIGRHFYAVGGNEKATKLSGINTNKVYFLAYTNMGLLSAFAGMLTIARMTSAQPTYGTNYEMDAIGACFIGGASAYGGVGTIPGVIIGAVLMGVINIGMSIMGVDANYQKVVKGAVLLAAVIFDVISKKKKEN